MLSSEPFRMSDSIQTIADVILKLETQREADVILDLRTTNGAPAFDVPAFKQTPKLLAITLPGNKPSLINVGKSSKEVIPLIRYLEKRSIVGHNLQTKLGILQHYYDFNITPGNAACVMAASQILSMGSATAKHELRPDLSLCHKRALGSPFAHTQALCWKGRLSPAHYQQVSQELEILPALHESFKKAIIADNLEAIWHLERHIMPALTEMQIVGMPVDHDRLQCQLLHATNEVQIQRAFLDTNVGRQFNPDSPEQVKALLPIPDCKDLTLRGLNDPNANAIYRFRVATRQFASLNAIIDGIGSDDRAHCIFDPLWAETGRIQTRNFNLQGVRGVPPGTPEAEIGQELRACFRAEPGKVLVSSDFRGEELRILAFYTEEPNLIGALQRGEDLHNNTASALFSKEIAKLLPEERSIGKQVNFGIIYGQGAKGLAKQLNIQEFQAKEFIESFYSQNRSVKSHKSTCWRMARGDVAEVRSLLGRRRWVPSSGTPRPGHKPPCQSDWGRFSAFFNGPIQGTGADALKIALDRLHGALLPDCRLVLPAHDSLMLECPDDKDVVMRVIRLIERTMLEAMDCLCFGFPFEIETKIGYNWAEMVHPDEYWARGNT